MAAAAAVTPGGMSHRACQMRIRSSQSLIFTPQAGAVLGYNYLSKSVFECTSDLLPLLSSLCSWSDFDAVAASLPDFERDELAEILTQLIALHALIEENSPLAAQEEEMAHSWAWGLPTALMHFSVQDNAFLTLDEAEAMQREKASAEGTVALYSRNPQPIALPDPLAGNALMNLMARRRTIRQSRAVPISLKALSDCLFSGLGITGETENCVGKLPLSMTPSGGARNPYEAYVFAPNVEGLESGIYHYAAIDHTLGRVANMDDVDLAALVGGQEWAADKPCMIVLVAELERTMWKYTDPNAYRVVMIEAGHIGQNIMLTATDQGLTACPTAALNHALVKGLLGRQALTATPVYALSLSVPAV
jgi:SagB-type dehydrogenase family enzyme